MDIIDIAIAKSYTAATAEGFGAVKGANCTISKTEQTANGTNITFQWKNEQGATQTRTILVKDGISIKDATISNDKHLLITLSDNRVIDTGLLPTADEATDVAYINANYPSIHNVKQGLDEALNGIIKDASDVHYTNSSILTIDNVKEALDYALSSGAKLEQSLTVSNPLGSASNGKVYTKDTKLETILRDILIKEVAPGLAISIAPSTTLYDVVDTTVSAITVKATCIKNTYNLSKVEFYLDNVLKYTQSISANGTYSYDMIWSVPTNKNFTIKAIVYDDKAGTPMSTSKTISVKFVGKSYYGYIDADTGNPTEAVIKALQNNYLKDTKSFVYDNINFDFGKVVYAYPASFGNLSSIKDVVNNINYTNSFSKTTVTIDGITYNCYTQNEPSAAADVQITFA